MLVRIYVTLTASTVLLAGCVQPPAADRSFSVMPGVVVPAGIPCGHVDPNPRASVPGCETFVANAGLDMPREQLIDLNARFRQEVQVIVNFDFDRDNLRPDSRAILDRQADWIRQYPGLRFSVFGHTDLVGSLDYNFGLAKRRADTAVAYLIARGVSRTQLESVVSFGKTQPVIDTPRREERNRRTVTEVSGFLRLATHTTAPISCDWIDDAYLPTYSDCIVRNTTPVVRPPPPPVPTPVPPPVVATYTGTSTGGTASITTNPDGSVTRHAEGITGPADDPRTETSATSTTTPSGGTGNLDANVTTRSGATLSASRTDNDDGTTTNQGGTQSVTN